MAWRDGRKNRSKLMLFLSSIVLGIAALVGINSFGDNLNRQIEGQARELLGADLTLETRDDATHIALELPVLDSAREVVFPSMVSFPGKTGARLIQVRALEGAFPFYGELVTEPASAGRSFQAGRQALVDRTLMIQFDAAPGATVRIGKVDFTIEGILDQAPGQTGITSAIAPTVYIPRRYLEETGLVQKGSRIEYRTHYRLAEGADVEAWVEERRDELRERLIRTDTVQEQREDTGRAFDDLNQFLGLVAFVALLLGCIGVASAVSIYIREKIGTVAVLRCLGATGRQAFLIFLLQIAAMGLLGAITGAIAGVGVQQLLPLVVRDFLPVEVDTFLSLPSIVLGILTGACMAVLFALAPLLQIRKASPLLTIRSSSLDLAAGRDPLMWSIYALVLLFIFAFAWFQLGDWREAGAFTLALLVAFALLFLVSRLVMWLVRRFFPVSWGFVWRQSLANLYRPHNQTLVLIATIGLGTALISTVFYVQRMLLEQVELTGEGERPNMVLFDIQNDQLAGVETLVRDRGLEVMQADPVVNMRIARIRGYSRSDVEADSTLEIPDWPFRREYRVTYRSGLSSSESIAAGEWIGEASGAEVIPVSIEQEHADRIGVEVGDRLVFDVQGVPLETRVASLREVAWNRVSSNFFVVFPAGVIEQAPQFHVLMTRVPGPEASAGFQQAVLQQFPTVSIINLGQILNTVEEVLGKVAFVIRFMALFSIFTGLIVLVSSVSLSRFQRLQESVLLRTLGSSRRQILIITLFEYFILGSLAALTGIVLAFLGTWALAYFSFETVFQPAIAPVLFIYLSITGLTVLIGFLNSRDVINRPPLEVLRGEA